MAQPVIESISHSKSPTGGFLLITVKGQNFRVSSTQAPSMDVRVGEFTALDIRVYSQHLLTFLTPPRPPGPADLTFRNLDDTGRPIPGEEVILAQTVVYEQSELAVESNLIRLVRAIIQKLKREVISNVTLTVQTDFDSETGSELHQTELASLPALVLSGPELNQNRLLSLNEPIEQDLGQTSFIKCRVPYTVDLTFTMIGVADHTIELLNMMEATQLFFHRNKFLELDRDPMDKSFGSVRYEIDVAQGGDFKITSQPNESNIRSFSGSFIIHGFDFSELAQFPGESVIAQGMKTSETRLPPIGAI